MAALGDQGPAGGLFRLAYEHVPGFVIMRAPWIANPAAQQARSDPPPGPLDHAHAPLPRVELNELGQATIRPLPAHTNQSVNRYAHSQPLLRAAELMLS